MRFTSPLLPARDGDGAADPDRGRRDGGVTALNQRLRELAAALPVADFERMYMTDLLRSLLDRGVRLTAATIQGGWLEIDSASDLALAERLVAQGRIRG